MTSPCRATSLVPPILRLRGLFILLLAQLSGCAINPPLKLAEISPARRPVLVEGVPFHAQQEFQCGPAALAGVLGASGIQIDPEVLTPQVYLPERRGSLQLELLAATRRAGRIAYVLRPDPRALLAELASGRPVLVMQNLRTRHFPVWHYAVLVGFDPEANEVILNSGTEPQLRMSAPAFQRTWDWANRWAMVALQPGELPAMPAREDLAEAYAAFEAVADPQTAETAWRAAAERFPHDPLCRLALGNLAYDRQRPHEAIAYYREGLALDSDDPALLNNLATVLGEVGCFSQAEAYLQSALKALPGDSPWQAILIATLDELEWQRVEGPDHCTALAAR